jgi:beta-N-acetylhexosaminidase
MLPAIFSLTGTTLSDAERGLFRDSDPAGFILFRRNLTDPGQLRALTADLRALAGRDDLPILIDQEGGRVVRLRPPHWPSFPAAEAFARLYEKAPISAIEAARLNGEALGAMLADVGINVDCAPVLDLRLPGVDDVVGDRSFGAEPMQVAALGRATLDGLAAAGVAGCIKHIPGHGRARVDSHKELPVVRAGRDELSLDFAPFRALTAAPIGMTAHIVYTEIDPDRPATQSPTVIEEVIRGEIGFDGLLLTDDIEMEALSGPVAERALLSLEAGCDLALHCSGRIEEMESLAESLGSIGEAARTRLDRALASIAGKSSPATAEALAGKRDALLAYA